MIDTLEIKSPQFYQIIVKGHHQNLGTSFHNFDSSRSIIKARFKSGVQNKCLFFMLFFSDQNHTIALLCLISRGVPTKLCPKM